MMSEMLNGCKNSNEKKEIIGIIGAMDDEVASLKLTKTVNGDDPNKTYKVAVKKGQQYVQDTNGTLKIKEHYFELSKDQTIEINNLKPGEYTIIEEEGDILGYSLESTEILVDGAQASLDANSEYPATGVTLSQNENKNVEIDTKVKNYTHSGGNVKITLIRDGK